MRHDITFNAWYTQRQCVLSPRSVTFCNKSGRCLYYNDDDDDEGGNGYNNINYSC